MRRYPNQVVGDGNQSRVVATNKGWTTNASARSKVAIQYRHLATERAYHRRQRRHALGKLTPVEFDPLRTPVVTAA